MNPMAPSPSAPRPDSAGRSIARSGFDEGSARLTTPTLQLRPYPRNSGEAAARIVALALIANGRIKAVETAVLDALEAPERLGLTRSQWHGVIDDLCADLLGTARCGNHMTFDSFTTRRWAPVSSSSWSRCRDLAEAVHHTPLVAPST
jgi:hypothetical protein